MRRFELIELLAKSQTETSNALMIVKIFIRTRQSVVQQLQLLTLLQQLLAIAVNTSTAQVISRNQSSKDYDDD